MKRYLRLNNNCWECEVHIKNWEFTMNEIEKNMRSYSLFTHKNELYKVEILADNKTIESKAFSDVFQAYSYMCMTDMHEKINKLYCPVNSGVKIIATAHAGSIEELKSRKHIKKLLKCGVFEYAVLLGNESEVGQVKELVKL